MVLAAGALVVEVVEAVGEIKIKVLNLSSGKNFYYGSCISFAGWFSNVLRIVLRSI